MKLPEIFDCLPAKLLHELYFSVETEHLEELHLRLGRRTEAVAGRKSVLLQYRAKPRDLQLLLEGATDHSLYAAQEYLREGFCTTRDGCRIGIAGRIAGDENGIRSIHDISAMNIRIAREVRGVAGQAAEFLRQNPSSTLIVGSPGCGKTTLLRDMIRLLSDEMGQRIGVADTRFELGASYQGVPRLYLGERTDILSGGEKEESIMLLLRTMSPEWIAVDEITSAGDVQALERCSYCGVHLLATAHASDQRDLLGRPVYKAMLERAVFQNLVVMDKTGQYRICRMEDWYV